MNNEKMKQDLTQTEPADETVSTAAELTIDAVNDTVNDTEVTEQSDEIDYEVTDEEATEEEETENDDSEIEESDEEESYEDDSDEDESDEDESDEDESDEEFEEEFQEEFFGKKKSKRKAATHTTEPVAYLDKEPADRLVQFLEYSGITNVTSVQNEINQSYEVRVPSKEFDKAQALYIVFSENELKVEEPVISFADETVGSLYENSSEKYKDYKSSAYTFFVCGFAGLIVVLLNDFKVINLFSQSGSSFIMINVVLGALFAAFIIIGVLSLRSSKKIKVEADKENELKKQINDWLAENVAKEDIDLACDDSIPEEMKYFSRQTFIRDKIQNEFNDLNDEMLDLLTDSYIEKLYHTK